MISVEEALNILNNSVRNFGVEEISLLNSLGRITREPWYADRDLPPYDRVTMDGIAIPYDTWRNGVRNFMIEGVAPAGSRQKKLENNLHCLEVMTGAVLPANCDTVIRYEDIEMDKGIAKIKVDHVKYGQNVHFKGLDKQEGEKVLEEGHIISSAEIGLGASIGKSKVVVSKRPKILIISTGDELVEIDSVPEDHQIRRSNIHQIQAALTIKGYQSYNEHLVDDKILLHHRLRDYVEIYDVIICSGGVSKGKFDFLPEVLEQIGVDCLFHKVAQRPGKPFWFGIKKDKCTVFALPGNPISSFLCFQKYVWYWLERCEKQRELKTTKGILNDKVEFLPKLTYFLEVELRHNDLGELMAFPKKGNGSGDLANMSKVDGFIQLPPNKTYFEKGDVYPILKYR